jgi:hypothetical protein
MHMVHDERERTVAVSTMCCACASLYSFASATTAPVLRSTSSAVAEVPSNAMRRGLRSTPSGTLRSSAKSALQKGLAAMGMDS